MYNLTGSLTADSDKLNALDSAFRNSVEAGMSKDDVYIDIRFADAPGNLYVSCDLIANGDKYITPSGSSFNFTSTLGGLMISADDTHFCGRPKNSGIFYIAVANNNNTHQSAYEFNITVSKYENPHRVTAGKAVYATVPMGLLAVYKFNLPSTNSQQITIALDCSLGDADLYVKIGLPVTLESYDYQSRFIGTQTEFVTISESAISDCAAKSCSVNIAAYGYTTAAIRLQVTLTDTDVLLHDNLPETSAVSKVRDK